MSCRSCRRHLGQFVRQARVLPAEATVAPVAVARLSTQARPAQKQQQQQQQQRRALSGSAPCRKSWVPQFVKDAAGQILRSSAQPYQVHAATETIYKTCARQAAYTISETDKRNGTVQKTEEGVEIGTGDTLWHNEFGLPATFSTWSQVTMLHMYLICARLRNLEREAAKSWQAQLVDHFFFDAEERMDVVHGLGSRGLRQRYLKDLFVQWRGVITAYDEGVVKGDAVLASAVWRNVFSARADVDARAVAAVVAWMRLCLKMLDQMPDEALFLQASATFKWPPTRELLLVDQPARELEGLLPDAPAPPQQQKKQEPSTAPGPKAAA